MCFDLARSTSINYACNSPTRIFRGTRPSNENIEKCCLSTRANPKEMSGESCESCSEGDAYRETNKNERRIKLDRAGFLVSIDAAEKEKSQTLRTETFRKRICCKEKLKRLLCYEIEAAKT